MATNSAKLHIVFHFLKTMQNIRVREIQIKWYQNNLIKNYKILLLFNFIFARAKMLDVFCSNFEVPAVQKDVDAHVNVVDLAKSFLTSIFIQFSS